MIKNNPSATIIVSFESETCKKQFSLENFNFKFFHQSPDRCPVNI
jgi:hypothetical protein